MPAKSGNRRKNREEDGFSLIEIVMSLVVLGLVVPVFMSRLAGLLQSNVESEKRNVSVELARSIMEEILSQNFEDPDESSGSFGTEEGSRTLYDDVDDYDGWSSAPPVDAAGQIIAGTTGFQRDIVVENVAAANLNQTVADGTSSFKRVTVSVVSPLETAVLRGLKGD